MKRKRIKRQVCELVGSSQQKSVEKNVNKHSERASTNTTFDKTKNNKYE